MRPRKQLIFLTLLFILGSNLLRGQTINSVVELVQQGHIAEARSLIEKMAPDNSPAETLFLQALLTIQADSAAVLYYKLLTDYPSFSYSDFALLRLGHLAYARGLYQQARSRYIGLREHFPGSGHIQESWYWLGRCYLALGQRDSAGLAFREAAYRYTVNQISELAAAALDSLGGRFGPGDQPQESGQEWVVQVGAFSQQQRALLRKSFFEQKGYQVRLATKRKDDVLLYLVWIGSFTDSEEARKFGDQLKKKYGTPFTLVSRQRDEQL